MNNIWLTSDTHFGHKNIMRYCNRPFNSIEEHDAALIDNWNALVKPNDTVYHLGDFCFGTQEEDFNKYFKRLNGQIILIKGNHDKLAWKFRHSFAASYDSYKEIRVDGQKVTLCHYSMLVWNCSHHGAFHLYGHSHGSLPDNPNSLSFDCGVDCHDYRPISWERVKEIMAAKKFVPIDHHRAREDET